MYQCIQHCDQNSSLHRFCARCSTSSQKKSRESSAAEATKKWAKAHKRSLSKGARKKTQPQGREKNAATRARKKRSHKGAEQKND